MKQYIVNKEIENMRLDKAVALLEGTLSRTHIQKLMEEDKITVNQKLQKTSYKVTEGDVIQIEEEPAKEIGIEAEKIPLNILYEDEDIIVINKAKGMVVHPAAGNQTGTLVNALMAHCKDSLSGIGGEIRPGIVHRLDKDTSGVMVVAKNDVAHISLAEQIKSHSIKKTYHALVRGVIKEDEATISMPIARSKKDRKKMAVDEKGKEAITHFHVLERYPGYTYVEVKIETGRTHQIRVHLSQIGYPIIGDEAYSKGKNEFDVHGQMLHSYELEFCHPSTKKNMKIKAQLPSYFEDILKILRSRN